MKVSLKYLMQTFRKKKEKKLTMKGRAVKKTAGTEKIIQSKILK